MSFYSDTRSDADALLREFGQSATLTQVGAGTHNVATQVISGGSTTSTTVTVVELSYKDGIVNQPGSSIQAGDRKFLMSGLTPAGVVLSVTPAPGDKLVVGGVTWMVKAVKTLKPGGTLVMHELQGRRS